MSTGTGIAWLGAGSAGRGCIGDDRFVVESPEGSEFTGKPVDSSLLLLLKFGMEFCGSWGPGMSSWPGAGANASVVASRHGAAGQLTDGRWELR